MGLCFNWWVLCEDQLDGELGVFLLFYDVSIRKGINFVFLKDGNIFFEPCAFSSIIVHCFPLAALLVYKLQS